MPEVIGFDPEVVQQHRLTCKKCGAINQYIEKEVQVRRYTIMGDPSGHKGIDCANCGEDVPIPGTSW